jgi:outer membrane protein OmpA-like peptidoglycan-associated protein
LSFDEKDAGLNRYTKIIIKSENGAVVKEVYRNEKGFQYEVLNNDKSLLSEIKAEDGSIPLSFIASIQDENLKLIPNLLVIVKEKNGEELYRTTTDNNGKLKLNQLVKDKNYDLEFDPNDPRIKSIKKIIIKSENNKLTKELVRKANGFHFNVLTSDKINLNELSTEEVNLSSIKTSKNSNSLAPKDEKVSSPKEQETEYHINLKAYVFDENNNILNHLAVIIKNKEGTVLKIDTTNMYGAFYVKDLPPQQDFEVEFDEKDSRLNKANKISIKSTNDTTLKQIEHKPSGYKLNLLKSDTTLLQKSHSEVEPSIQLDFKASVLDDKNKPLPNFTITLKDENNHIIKKQTTDKNGKIVFDHLLGSENHKLEFDENDPRIKNIGKILIKSDDGKMTREVKRVEKGFEYSLNKIETDLMDEYKITELENIKVEKLYKKKGKIVKVKEELSFNTGDAVLQQEQKEFINKINKILKQTPELKLEVSGYADSRSGEKTNLLLSEKRAKTVGDYLIEQGIPRPRIITIGYGESRLKTKCPDFSECTEAQHAENRRVEFRLFVD